MPTATIVDRRHFPRSNVTPVHIVIMGCGRVGATLTRSLEERGHSTAVIDINPEAFRRLGPDFRGITVTGMGFDRGVLEEADIQRADAFAAVSSGDNSNIISARVARELYGVKNVVARIYDPGRAEVYERLGVPTVATVPWAADQVLRRLLPVGSEPSWRDASGEVRLDQLYAPVAWIGHEISVLEDQAGARVAFVTRLGSGMIPTADTVIQEGDYLSIFMREDHAEETHAVLDRGPEEEA
jgi:trk system potassium uptake protein TrkA